MTVRELLERLAREGLVDPAKLDAEAANAALQPYQREHLRVQQAGSSASVWFGAFFLAFFLIVNDITKHPPAAVTFGAIALVAAAAISREAVTLLRLQLVWIAVIFGQALIVAALADVSDSVTTTALTVLALEAVTIAAVRNLTVACAAVVAAVVALLALIDDLDLARHGYDLMALSLGTGTCLLWVHEAQLGARLGRLWQPLAYTLPVGLLLPLVAALESPGEPTWITAATAGWAALSAWLIGQAGREAPELRGAPQWLAWVAIAAAAAIGHGAPGISAGVALLLLAHLRRSLPLQTFALLTLGGFLFFWYYNLGSSLLTKSLIAVGNGLVFLVAATALRRGAGRPREREARPLADRIGALRWLGLALTLALAIPAWLVTQKETVIASGETVLLRLRPVDPRSLMQGDYMDLAYAIVDELPDREALAPRGALIITRDADNVARFVRLDDGRALAPGELRLRYFKRGRGVSLGAESFFFPEGQGQPLAEARYGELALGGAGDSVLIGLRDEQRRPLGPRLHDR